MFKHILVPTDGSRLSQDTVRHAVIFAQEIGARITAFYAKPEFPIPYYFGESALIDPTSPEKFSEEINEQAEEVLNFVKSECARANIECQIASATSDLPYEAIIEAAEKNNCDLIFMATHGRKGIAGLLLGSETQKILKHSRIPVLVFR